MEKQLPWILCEFQVKTVAVDVGVLEDQFDTSVKMSTYLVAFVICDFKSVTATSSSGVQVSPMIFVFPNSFGSSVTFLCTVLCFVPVGVHLCHPWEVDSNHLCPGSRSQNARFLWRIFQYPISSAKARYYFVCQIFLCHFLSSNIFYLTDLIAIPDFQSGAMENWGLTTYRETSLLFDPNTSCISDKLWVTMVIGHELAHQASVILKSPERIKSIVLNC